MKLRLILSTRDWQCCMPQAGTFDGWSSWEFISRLQALDLIERGFSFTTVDYP